MKIKAKYICDAIQFDGSLDAVSKFFHKLGWNDIRYRFFNFNDGASDNNAPDYFEITVQIEGKERVASGFIGDWIVMRNIDDEWELSTIMDDYFHKAYTKQNTRNEVQP